MKPCDTAVTDDGIEKKDGVMVLPDLNILL